MASLVTNCYLDDRNVSYSSGDVIGRGGFGVVYRGLIHVENLGDQLVAIKKINLSCYDEKTKNEEPMFNFKHDNVVKIVKVLADDEFRYLIMEMCIGTLAQVIDGSFKGPNLPSDVSVLRDIASGLHYIHVAKFVHRNIKPENILISQDSRMKISDLNYADCTTQGRCCWKAQELLEKLINTRTLRSNSGKSNSRKVTPSSDIFSAGCVFFVFVTREFGGVHPFGKDYTEQSHNIRKGEPVNIEKLPTIHYAHPIIEKMIAHSPRDRKPLPDVLKMLESAESTELNHSQQENQSDSLSGDTAGSSATNSNEELLAMNVERHPFENVGVKLEHSEFESRRNCDELPCSSKNVANPKGVQESNAEALINGQSKPNCVKAEPLDTENSSPEAAKDEIANLDPNKPQIAPLVDPQNEIKMEVEEPIRLGIEGPPKEDLISFRQRALDSTPAKRIEFHPIHSDLLCFDSPGGVITIQEHSIDSLISCNRADSKVYVKWNIDGTKLAAAYKYGPFVIWEYPSCKIIYRRKRLTDCTSKNCPCDECNYNQRVQWNQFSPNVVATYKWDAKFVILVWLVGRSCSQFEIPDKNDPMRLSCRVRTVEWISKDRIAVAYSNGLINLYHSNGTETPALRNTIQTYQLITHMAWNEKHQLLAAGSYEGSLMVWKISDRCTLIYRYTDDSICTFDARCNSLAWQPENEKRELGAPLVAVGVESSYPTLACGFENGAFVVWAPFLIQKDSNPTHRLPQVGGVGPVGELLFSPDGNYLASFSFDKELYVYHTKTWKEITEVKVNQCREASWNASSNKLAIVKNLSSDVKKPNSQLVLFEIEPNGADV